ncbi:DUF2092 domain-containing protein [Aliisedimentitalea scapharcae]|uniref:DUF2092 domain-containing protein n=1 Tax=Aliisedimentitalea scapharcae TaxID=1524259 RepID=A0ABZ2XQ28_9RHOB|nr:DUF2092 domain-containing protein [Rhodobacteraceae bacterium M382]
MLAISTLRRVALGVVFALPFATALPAETADNTGPADDPIDAQARDLIQAATDFLSNQDKLQVNWFVTYDTVVDGREKLTDVRSGFTFLSRSEGFVSATENGLKSRDFYFDGAAFYIVDPDANSYVLAPFEGSYEDLIVRIRDEYDMALPIWSILSNRSKGEWLESAESAAYLGVTRIAGREVHHIAASNYDHDWQLWISTDAERPELVMLVGTDPYQQGWPQYRVYFHDWVFDPDYDPNVFAYTPDEDASRMAWPKPVLDDANSGPQEGDE